jgi:hypothetical protein
MADSVIALAILHHMVIGRNIPINEAVDWLIGLAPVGVIEFVPKSDPMVQKMLSLRDDIFDDYNLDTFLNAVSTRARIIESQTITESTRQLVIFERT